MSLLDMVRYQANRFFSMTEEASYHEVGHAVVAKVLGVTDILIGNSCCTVVYPDSTEDILTILVAGVVSEGKDIYHDMGAADLREARRHGATDEDLARASDRARQILEAHQAEVDELVPKLIARGEIRL